MPFGFPPIKHYRRIWPTKDLVMLGFARKRVSNKLERKNSRCVTVTQPRRQEISNQSRNRTRTCVFADPDKKVIDLFHSAGVAYNFPFWVGAASRVPFFLAFPLSTTHTKMSRNTAPNTATTTMRTLPSYLEASTPKEDEYQRAVTILQNFHRFQTTFDLDVIHENDDDDDDRSDTSATGPATTTGRRHPRMILLRTQATDRLTTLATINHHDDDDDANANVHHVTQQR